MIQNPYSRRQIVGGSLAAIGGFALLQGQTHNAIVAASSIHQEEDFKAPPARIYQALLDSRQFAAFSGGRAAEIHPQAGATFSVFEGHIVGRNIELVPDRRIVQAWRVVNWAEGMYSMAKFELQPQGAGTRIVFDHAGFPQTPGEAEHLASGWQENYWQPLRKYLA
jgi:activator of HSP90 ATPase